VHACAFFVMFCIVYFSHTRMNICHHLVFRSNVVCFNCFLVFLDNKMQFTIACACYSNGPALIWAPRRNEFESGGHRCGAKVVGIDPA